MDGLLRRWEISRPDALLAVGLTLLCLVELHSEAYRSPLQAGLLVLPLLSLAWRNRWPAAVAVVVLSTVVIGSAASPALYGPQLPLLAIVLALYTVAAQLHGRAMVLAGAVTLALVEVAHVVTRDGDLADFFPLVVWGAPWAAGRLVRRRTLEAAAVARAAAELSARQEQETREAVARERDRIARELHDVVAHAVSLMVVQAGAERLALGSSSPRTSAALEAVEAAGREALGELRAMLAVLRAPDDDAQPVASAHAPLPALADLRALAQLVRAAGSPVELVVVGEPASVPPGVGLSAYRVVQEALTNVVKHAPGCPDEVRVTAGPSEVDVEVRNPLGAVPAQAGAGRGLVGIAERAALLGGDADAGPCDGAWVVRARLPVPTAVPSRS